MLDTARRIATPEGIELALRLAGPVPRAGAWALDFLLRLAILAVLAMILGVLGGFGTGVFLLCWFFLEWLFPAWCEVNWGGATPGLYSMRLRPPSPPPKRPHGAERRRAAWTNA